MRGVVPSTGQPNTPIESHDMSSTVIRMTGVDDAAAGGSAVGRTSENSKKTDGIGPAYRTDRQSAPVDSHATVGTR